MEYCSLLMRIRHRRNGNGDLLSLLLFTVGLVLLVSAVDNKGNYFKSRLMIKLGKKIGYTALKIILGILGTVLLIVGIVRFITVVSKN